MNFKRYALYYAPPYGSTLEQFGQFWLSQGSSWSPSALSQICLSDEEIQNATKTPARYGFHGTLKAPFKLKDSIFFQELDQALENFSNTRKRVETGSLRLKEIGQFLALCPSGPLDDLNNLARECLEEFDSLRAPLTDQEIEKRRAVGLTTRQDELMLQWGYPYVLDEFRFHLTLTGRLDEGVTSRFKKELMPLIEQHTIWPFCIDEICLFGDPGEGKAFQEIKRYQFMV